MKESIPFDKGRVVQSTQGRDRGHYFIVLDSAGPDLVWVADGRLHPLNRPKKKKFRHLHAKPIVIELKAIRPEGGKLQDSDLRRALEKLGFAEDRSLCKEG